MSTPQIVVPSGTGGVDSRKLQKLPKPIEERLQTLLDRALYAGGRPEAQRLRNFLNGTWLGEPLHAVLKDIPVGAWTVAMIFDALSLIRSDPEFAWAADATIATGLAGAACAAAAGVTDWSDVDSPARGTDYGGAVTNCSTIRAHYAEGSVENMPRFCLTG